MEDVQMLYQPSSPAFSNPDSGIGTSVMDFMLLHHYTTSTCLTFCTETTLRDFWRVVVPRLSFETPYLLHGILSLAALHIARYNKQKRDVFVSQAMLHHNASLAIASPLMTNLDATNCESLFLFSTITSYFALGRPKDPHDYLLVRNQDIPIWLSLVRGVRLVIDMQWETLKSSVLLPLFQHGERAHKLWVTCHCEEEALDDLAQNIRTAMSEDPGTWQHLSDTIDALRRSFAITRNTNIAGEVGDLGVSLWLVMVSDEFFDLVKNEQNEALCILGFFAVLLKWTEHSWWTEGWGIHLIQAVYSLLDESHKLWIRWPIEEIGWVPSL